MIFAFWSNDASEYSVLVNSQVPPISSGSSVPSGPPGDESAMLRSLREKVSRMEKDMMVIHAGVAVSKKKGEIAAQAAAYAEKDMKDATEELWCK